MSVSDFSNVDPVSERSRKISFRLGSFGDTVENGDGGVEGIGRGDLVEDRLVRVKRRSGSQFG